VIVVEVAYDGLRTVKAASGVACRSCPATGEVSVVGDGGRELAVGGELDATDVAFGDVEGFADGGAVEDVFVDDVLLVLIVGAYAGVEIVPAVLPADLEEVVALGFERRGVRVDLADVFDGGGLEEPVVVGVELPPSFSSVMAKASAWLILDNSHTLLQLLSIMPTLTGLPSTIAQSWYCLPLGACCMLAVYIYTAFECVSHNTVAKFCSLPWSGPMGICSIKLSWNICRPCLYNTLLACRVFLSASSASYCCVEFLYPE